MIVPSTIFFSAVLIETLWNVNVNICENLRTEIRINRNIVECKLYSRSCRCSCILVLIETLWNVNIENYDRTEEWSDRINRNIVECKSEYVPAVSTWSSCINRNIVECKFGKNVAAFYHTHVLIETLWNVNLLEWHDRKLLGIVLIETLWNVNWKLRQKRRMVWE